jgi:aryl-alcohol dehydrogenase-like predicted oxidoreductase
MNYRKLGATGLEVSEIGFGAWGIGGTNNGAIGYGPVDQDESIAALRLAYESGVTLFDTSDFYGYGLSEQLIGQALGDVRDRIVIVTKVGTIDADENKDFSPGHIRRSIESSLKRLQTDYVDLYLLHSPTASELEECDGAVATLKELRDEGKIKSFGISLDSPEDGFFAIDKFGVQAIQVNFNMIDQRAITNGLFKLCEANQVGIIGRTPLCFGFLTGHYSSSDDFHTQDHRGRWPSKQIDTWADSFSLFAAMVDDSDNQTPAQVALRYCLSYSQVSSVIPGMLTNRHVEENISASTFGPLSNSERKAVEQIYQDHEFFLGKAAN